MSNYPIELNYYKHLHLSVTYRRACKNGTKIFAVFIESDIGYAIARANMVKESLKDRYEWVAIFHYKGESWKRMKLRGGSARKLIFGAPRREKRSPSLRGTKKALSTSAK